MDNNNFFIECMLYLSMRSDTDISLNVAKLYVHLISIHRSTMINATRRAIMLRDINGMCTRLRQILLDSSTDAADAPGWKGSLVFPMHRYARIAAWAYTMKQDHAARFTFDLVNSGAEYAVKTVLLAIIGLDDMTMRSAHTVLNSALMATDTQWQQYRMLAATVTSQHSVSTTLCDVSVHYLLVEPLRTNLSSISIESNIVNMFRANRADYISRYPDIEDIPDDQEIDQAMSMVETCLHLVAHWCLENQLVETVTDHHPLSDIQWRRHCEAFFDHVTFTRKWYNTLKRQAFAAVEMFTSKDIATIKDNEANRHINNGQTSSHRWERLLLPRAHVKSAYWVNMLIIAPGVLAAAENHNITVQLAGLVQRCHDKRALDLFHVLLELRESSKDKTPDRGILMNDICNNYHVYIKPRRYNIHAQCTPEIKPLTDEEQRAIISYKRHDILRDPESGLVLCGKRVTYTPHIMSSPRTYKEMTANAWRRRFATADVVFMKAIHVAATGTIVAPGLAEGEDGDDEGEQAMVARCQLAMGDAFYSPYAHGAQLLRALLDLDASAKVDQILDGIKSLGDISHDDLGRAIATELGFELVEDCTRNYTWYYGEDDEHNNAPAGEAGAARHAMLIKALLRMVVPVPPACDAFWIQSRASREYAKLRDMSQRCPTLAALTADVLQLERVTDTGKSHVPACRVPAWFKFHILDTYAHDLDSIMFRFPAAGKPKDAVKVQQYEATLRTADVLIQKLEDEIGNCPVNISVSDGAQVTLWQGKDTPSEDGITIVVNFANDSAQVTVAHVRGVPSLMVYVAQHLVYTHAQQPSE